MRKMIFQDLTPKFLQVRKTWWIAGLVLFAGAFGVWHIAGGGVVTAESIFKDMIKDLERMRKAKPWPKAFDENHSNPYRLLDVKVEDWLATEEGRAAHAIKIPNPVAEDSGYVPGMTQQQYFKHLCENEAGEFIYKTADNVEGIYQIRPRKNVYSEEELQHLYAMEDPYGHYTEENEDIGFEMVEPLKYSFFEIPVAGARKYGASAVGRRDPSLLISAPLGATIARYSGLGIPDAGRTTMKL